MKRGRLWRFQTKPQQGCVLCLSCQGWCEDAGERVLHLHACLWQRPRAKGGAHICAPTTGQGCLWIEPQQLDVDVPCALLYCRCERPVYNVCVQSVCVYSVCVQCVSTVL